MITRFRVQNYKALRDVTLELTPMHLLIGPNDSGKTSILEAIAALCRSVDHELDTAFLDSRLGASLVWHDAEEPIVRFEVWFDSNDRSSTRYQLAAKFPLSKGRVTLAEESVFPAEGGEARIGQIGRFSTNLFLSLRNPPASNLGGPDNLKLVLSVCEKLKGIHFYRWVPNHLALPVAPDSTRRFRMEASGFGLALCLDDILGYDRDRFIALENRFRTIFPQVESIKLISEAAYKAPVDNPNQVLILKGAEGKGIYFGFKGNSQPISASQVSDGMLLVLAYLAILYVPEAPRVLLVEEPENGIHPSRLEQVLTILRDLVSEQSHTQVILTTHSPYVVSLFRPKEVTVCRKGDDGAVEVRRLSESEAVQNQVDFFTLGEIWTSEGDDALMEPVKTANEPS